MDDNIRMTVVINPLVSPLLHEALADCRTPRERAMRLRALAESALREPSQQGRNNGRAERVEPPQLERPRPVPVALQETGVQILRVEESATNGDGFASASLGEELAAFL